MSARSGPTVVGRLRLADRCVRSARPDRLSLRARPRGQALVELAIVLPILVLLLLIAIDFGRLFFTYIAVHNAAREAAAFGQSHPTCVTSASGPTCADPLNMTWIAQHEAGSGSASLNVSASCASTCATTSATKANTVTVTVSTQFTFLTPFLTNGFGSIWRGFGGPLSIGTNATAVIL